MHALVHTPCANSFIQHKLQLPFAVLMLCCLYSSNVAGEIHPVVVVGVTPTCPYGLSACGPAAREGLQQLTGVELVAQNADLYNCTFDVRINPEQLPDIEKWKSQFRNVVGDVFVFRGIEISVIGQVVIRDDVTYLEAEELRQPILLRPLENKLQWNFKKKSHRQPEPDEGAAFANLLNEVESRQPLEGHEVQVIGPLKYADTQPTVEVREYYFQSK